MIRKQGGVFGWSEVVSCLAENSKSLGRWHFQTTNIPPVSLTWHSVTPEEWWIKTFIQLTAVSKSHFSTKGSISPLANVFILGRLQCFVCVCLASYGYAWSKEGGDTTHPLCDRLLTALKCCWWAAVPSAPTLYFITEINQYNILLSKSWHMAFEGQNQIGRSLNIEFTCTDLQFLHS